MPDVHDSATRSRNMSAIKGKDTKPEMAVRRALHAAGFRYRLHVKDLPGRPDLVLPKYRAVVFVHGCFWHQHDCSLFKVPVQRAEFWQEKLSGNVSRDTQATACLLADGWRVATVWECALKGSRKLGLDRVGSDLAMWLKSSSGAVEFREA